MKQGSVRWFSLRKGYGFIIPSDGAKDVFVHISELQKAGIGFLVPGRTVGFDECYDRCSGRYMASNICLTKK